MYSSCASRPTRFTESRPALERLTSASLPTRSQNLPKSSGAEPTAPKADTGTRAYQRLAVVLGRNLAMTRSSHPSQKSTSRMHGRESRTSMQDLAGVWDTSGTHHFNLGNKKAPFPG